MRHYLNLLDEERAAFGAEYRNDHSKLMRFDSSEIGQTMSEIVAYGTAVVVESDKI